jgi:hypothetical protein
MKFSEAMEKYLSARDSLNSPFCHDDRKVEMRKVMVDCAQQMDDAARAAQPLAVGTQGAGKVQPIPLTVSAWRCPQCHDTQTAFGKRCDCSTKEE